MNLKEAALKLQLFSELPEIDEILTVINQERSVNRSSLFSPSLPTEYIDVLRKKTLKVFLNDDNYLVTRQGIHLIDACHDMLLVLAQLKPVNPEIKIEQTNRVFISSGHQIDIQVLINHHNTRAPLNDREMRSNFKTLMNPITESPFHSKDAAIIQEMAQKKSLTIKWLVYPNKFSARALAIKIKHINEQTTVDDLTQALDIVWQHIPWFILISGCLNYICLQSEDRAIERAFTYCMIVAGIVGLAPQLFGLSENIFDISELDKKLPDELETAPSLG